MRKFKRITAFFLTAIMVLLMGSSVLATELPSDKPDPRAASLDGHTYEAYQVFAGSHYKSGGNDKLTEVTWGDGIEAEAFFNAIKGSKDFGTSNPFASITYEESAKYKSADAVAQIIKNWKADSPEARAFARLADQNKTAIKNTYDEKDTSNLAPGYYLIVDITPAEKIQNSARNLSVLKQIGLHDNAPKNKTDVPELLKQVKEVDDSTGTEVWGKTADYDIGDDVEFLLTGTLPTDYASYVEYKYVFHDTLSAALRLNATKDKEGDLIKVTIDGKTATGYTFEQNGQSFTITFNDLKKNTIPVNKDSIIRVQYSAKLVAEGLVYGGAGNENTARLQYSNDPNYNGGGNPPTGFTPEDKVVVFTYQLIVNKKDEAGNDLAGADFTLYKWSKAANDYVIVGNEDAAEETTGGTTGGTVEGTTEENAVETEGEPTEETVEGTTGENTVETTEETTDETTGEPEGETKEETAGETTGETVSGNIVRGAVQFTFRGIDAGRYKLVESKTPAGYNRADDMYFTVVAEGNVKDGVTKLEITTVSDVNGKEFINADKTKVFVFTPNLSEGSLSTNIVNLKGLLFPSTGGIGTTIFYVIGGILVVGAGVLLILKKRAGKSE